MTYQAHVRSPFTQPEEPWNGAHLDSAAESRDADEFEHDPEHAKYARYMDRLVAQLKESAAAADAEEHDDMVDLVSGMDEAMLKLSSGLLLHDRAKTLDAYRELMDVRKAMVELL